MAMVSCNKQNFQIYWKRVGDVIGLLPTVLFVQLCFLFLFLFSFLFILVHKQRCVSGIKWRESSLQQKNKNCLTEHGLVNRMIQSWTSQTEPQANAQTPTKKWEDNQKNLWVIPRARQAIYYNTGLLECQLTYACKACWKSHAA